MRNYIKPPKIAKVLAMTCQYHNLTFIYFRPKDIDMSGHKVKGKMLLNNKWISVEKDIPSFIDVTSYSFKYTEIMNYLNDKAELSDDGKNRMSKEKLQKLLLDNNNFKHLAIPTKKVSDQSNIEEFLNDYNKVVLKPISGQQGKGVYSLTKIDDYYKCEYQKTEFNLSKVEFYDFYKKYIESNNYIIQKYVSSKTSREDPYDCRVHVEKNGKGEWVIAKMYIRIGLGQKITSNIHQGGGVCNPKTFLKSNFGEKWESIYRNTKQVCLGLSQEIEKYRDQKLMVLGFDVGIDQSGEIYLFEVNSAPIVDHLKAEVGLLRSEYYKYMVSENTQDEKETKPLKKKKRKPLKVNNNKEKIKQLEKEVLTYKKRIENIENSRSWRLTKPIRKPREILKNMK